MQTQTPSKKIFRPKYTGWRQEPPVVWTRPGKYVLTVAKDGQKREVVRHFKTEEDLKKLVSRWRDQKVGNVIKARIA